MKARAHLFINGMVQGVGYRVYLSEVAASYGLKGWVMNLPDLRIEAVFEGERKSIESAVKKCSEGTHSAIVSGIDVNWEESPEDLTFFRIRY